MTSKSLFIMIGLLLLGGGLISGCLSAETNSPPTASLQKEPTAAPSPTSTLPPNPPESSSNINCTEYNPHPMGESIAEKFSAEYEDVMSWYCDGYAFEDILLALQTSQLAGEPAGKILDSLETQSWEEIWEKLGLTAE